MSTLLITIISIFFVGITHAQFAPPAGEPGSTAIDKNSSSIVAWATGCTVQRGYIDITQPSLGLASSGQTNQVIGIAGGGAVLSLGDSGVATVTFDYPIMNGPGPDFAVFENSFSNTFLELGFVEVSSDGVNFVRFPAISNTDTTVQIGGFGHVDATLIHNFAGKYRAGFGTPFDLEDLVGLSPNLNLNEITHVRIVDAIGCIQDAYCSRDSRGIKVNDPWNTPFATGGFDLDAVGVIHSNTNIAIQTLESADQYIYPNPIQQGTPVIIEHPSNDYQVNIYTLQGQLIQHFPNSPQELPTEQLQPNSYIIVLQDEQKTYIKKLVIW